MIESPVQGRLKHTLDQIAVQILAGSRGELSMVCLRLDSGAYRIEAHQGGLPADMDIPSVDFLPGDGGAGARVAQTGEPQVIAEYARELTASPYLGPIATMGVNAIVNAPVGPKGDVIAVLYVMSRTPGRFDESDMSRLVLQANMAEVAIRNAL
jgi:signal transduction protein with GAF and PtsI domain